MVLRQAQGAFTFFKGTWVSENNISLDRNSKKSTVLIKFTVYFSI